jgi:hypothetical protein
MHIESRTQQHCYVFPKNLICTLAGFEPGPAVSESDAMSTAPRRQNYYINSTVEKRRPNY